MARATSQFGESLVLLVQRGICVSESANLFDLNTQYEALSDELKGSSADCLNWLRRFTGNIEYVLSQSAAGSSVPCTVADLSLVGSGAEVRKVVRGVVDLYALAYMGPNMALRDLDEKFLGQLHASIYTFPAFYRTPGKWIRTGTPDLFNQQGEAADEWVLSKALASTGMHFATLMGLILQVQSHIEQMIPANSRVVGFYQKYIRSWIPKSSFLSKSEKVLTANERTANKLGVALNGLIVQVMEMIALLETEYGLLVQEYNSRPRDEGEFSLAADLTNVKNWLSNDCTNVLVYFAYLRSNQIAKLDPHIYRKWNPVH